MKKDFTNAPKAHKTIYIYILATILTISLIGIISFVVIREINKNETKEVAFIGNSLLIGNKGFGMCATDENNDYFYHIDKYLKNRYPNINYQKMSGIPFEGIENKEDIDTTINEMLGDQLNKNTKLVTIQLGDNVNNEKRVEAFSESIYKLIKKIKEQAPNANIIWVGEWYASAKKQEIIKEACEKEKIYFVDISDLNTKENQAKIGDIVTYKNGEQKEITNEGVASHPNNKTFKMIADRIIQDVLARIKL